jgi:hypothetical protein
MDASGVHTCVIFMASVIGLTLFASLGTSLYDVPLVVSVSIVSFHIIACTTAYYHGRQMGDSAMNNHDNRGKDNDVPVVQVRIALSTGSPEIEHPKISMENELPSVPVVETPKTEATEASQELFTPCLSTNKASCISEPATNNQVSLKQSPAPDVITSSIVALVAKFTLDLVIVAEFTIVMANKTQGAVHITGSSTRCRNAK